MVITNDFVFIHFPKNAGSFVTECIYNLYDGTSDKQREKALMDYVKRFTNRESTNYSFKYMSEALEFTGENIRTQHQGCDHIPPAHSHKEIVSTIRNPFDRYISLYKYAWWKRYPLLSNEELTSLYPSYPDISFEEYLDLALNHYIEVTKKKNNISLDVGLSSLYYLKLYCKNYMQILSNAETIDEITSDDFYEVTFLKQEKMREELFQYLKKFGWPEDKLESIMTHEKVNTSRADFSYREYYTDETIELVYRKEELIFKLFPHYLF